MLVHDLILCRIFRTVSNCQQKHTQKLSSAAGAPPRNDDVQVAGGDADGETSGKGEESNQGVVDEVTITPILQDDGQPICELVETTKPLKKGTKRSWE